MTKYQAKLLYAMTGIFMLLSRLKVHAWSFSSVARKCHTCVMSATIVASSQFLYLPIDELPSYCAYAAEVEILTVENLNNVVYDSIKDNDTNMMWMDTTSLSPPTSQRPQIKPQAQLTSPSSKTPNTRNPIVQGLVYMADAKDRPDPSDVIVLTVSSVSAPDQIIAGAIYPVYKARIPFNFQFYQANILKGKENLYKQSVNEDYLVEASVCPQEAIKLPCTSEERLYEARGISKMIQLPGMIEQALVRVPATLPLENVGSK